MDDEEIDEHGKEILFHYNYKLPANSKESIALIKTVKHFEKQARASERKKILGDPCSACEIERREKEAYAKGKADLEAEIKFAKPAIDRFDELLRQEAYAKGQADLVGKLKHTIETEAKDTVWLTDYETMWDAIIRVASESLGKKEKGGLMNMSEIIVIEPKEITEQRIMDFISNCKKFPTMMDIYHGLGKQADIFGIVHHLEDTGRLGTSMRRFGKCDRDNGGGYCKTGDHDGVHGFERFYWVRNKKKED